MVSCAMRLKAPRKEVLVSPQYGLAQATLGDEGTGPTDTVAISGVVLSLNNIVTPLFARFALLNSELNPPLRAARIWSALWRLRR